MQEAIDQLRKKFDDAAAMYAAAHRDVETREGMLEGARAAEREAYRTAYACAEALEVFGVKIDFAPIRDSDPRRASWRRARIDTLAYELERAAVALKDALTAETSTR